VQWLRRSAAVKQSEISAQNGSCRRQGDVGAVLPAFAPVWRSGVLAALAAQRRQGYKIAC